MFEISSPVSYPPPSHLGALTSRQYVAKHPTTCQPVILQACWWKKSGDHQLRLVVYPIIYRVLYIPGGCLGFLNHQQYVEILCEFCMIWKPFFTNYRQDVLIHNSHPRKNHLSIPKDPEFTHSTTVKPMCLNNRLKMLFLSRQWLHKFLNYGISCPKSNTFLNHYKLQHTSTSYFKANLFNPSPITHIDAISIIPHHSRDICASPTFLRYGMPPLRRSATLRWWAPQVAAEVLWTQTWQDPSRFWVDTKSKCLLGQAVNLASLPHHLSSQGCNASTQLPARTARPWLQCDNLH